MKERGGKSLASKSYSYSNITLGLALGVVYILVTSLTGCYSEKLSVLSAKPADLEGVSTFTLQLKNYCPSENHTFQDFLGRNLSVHITPEGYSTDRDRDGLPNSFETKRENINLYDINYKKEDSNDDCHADFVMVKLGFDFYDQAKLDECIAPYNDLDNDGLWDGDEDILRTDSSNPDTDGDGIPDGYEIRIGTSPLDKNDVNLDADNDGFTNNEEWHMGTPIDYSNSEDLNKRSYDYDVKNVVYQDQPCFDLTFSNVPILEINRQSTDSLVNGNYLELLIFELGNDSVSKIKTLTIIVSPLIESDSNIVIEYSDDETSYLVSKEGDVTVNPN